jgi:S-adenosyl-L-methionine hydrolase (adenosine-forming)
VKTAARKQETGRRDAKPSRRPVSASLLRSPRAAAGGSDSRASNLITLLTDFGTADYFVAAVKGVILASNPKARMIDITHQIAPHDIEAGAFTLLAACGSFPGGTVHLAVVDPGVGSLRRPILIEAHGQFFVGPDNGIFSYVCDRSAPTEIVHLTNTKYFRHPVSPTFNGRDIFAPVAAALSTGVKPTELGEKIEDYVKLKPLKPAASLKGEIVGRIIHIDRFGNCVTNITQIELTPELIAAGAKLRVRRKLVKSFRSYFAEDTGSKERVFAIWGSAGFLEIAAAQESAAKVLNTRRGDEVIVSM